MGEEAERMERLSVGKNFFRITITPKTTGAEIQHILRCHLEYLKHTGMRIMPLEHFERVAGHLGYKPGQYKMLRKRLSHSSLDDKKIGADLRMKVEEKPKGGNKQHSSRARNAYEGVKPRREPINAKQLIEGADRFLRQEGQVGGGFAGKFGRPKRTHRP